MRQVTRKGLITVAAATGVLAVSGGYAHADSGAEGGSSGSPGVLSGNTIQLPVDIPVNACGNTVNVVGLLNPAAGNDCANTSKPAGGHPGGSHHGGGATAEGGTSDSPGVGSGNHVQVPVHVPVNACGNGVSVIGLLNPAGGNDCANSPGGDKPTTPPTKPPTQPEPNTPAPPKPVTPSTPNHPGTQTVTQPEGSEQLAETGSSMPLGTVLPAGAGALLAGALLYRRARAGV
ncbi:chaplin [Streptomyces sp. NPDC058695]|uniref:chaplin n=1 Tax=Streptomyces sp. NPDC058695 TaxID=3346604 RepID=UPI003663E0B6